MRFYRYLSLIFILIGFGMVNGKTVMTKIQFQLDDHKPVMADVLLKDSTQIFISSTTMTLIFGPSAHLQNTEKSILACIEDLCVPYSKKNKKNDLIEYKDEWYLNLNSFSLTIGKIFRWIEPGKSVEIETVELKSLESSNSNYPIAPEFRLPDSHGKLISLSDYRGKKVLVSLWASW